MAESVVQEEHLDVLTMTGQKTGITKPRHVHFNSITAFNF